jgi:ATP-dependent Clp protease protease subunit
LILLSPAVLVAAQVSVPSVPDAPAVPDAAPAASPAPALPATPLAAPSLGSGSAARAPRAAASSSPASPAGAGSPVAGSPGSFGGLNPFGGPMCGGPEHQDLDKITTLNMIELQKGQQKLRPISAERDETTARYGLLMDQQKLALAPQEQELHELQLAASLRDERFRKEIEPLHELQERLRLDNEIAHEKLVAEELKADEEKLKMDVATRELDFESRKLKMETELADHKTVALKADLDLRAKKEEWRKETNRDPVYSLEPFKDGVLTMSDRRIPLNGPIVRGVADYVSERIHYFNNKDESLPIFIVIDDSPGGSVMEGYRIVKAIQASKAPVHVVVKSFAASMAAVITTLAPHSYAYPNAVILHHQMSSGAFGNMTEQAEQLEINKEWFRRLGVPVAQKMGLSLDGWVKEMYKHNSDGDWEEFADKAVALKWVDNIVHEIKETGYIKEPEDKSEEKPKMRFGLAEEVDARGDRFVRLPRLQPFDAYWIYNPGTYYR